MITYPRILFELYAVLRVQKGFIKVLRFYFHTSVEPTGRVETESQHKFKKRNIYETKIGHIRKGAKQSLIRFFKTKAVYASGVQKNQKA